METADVIKVADTMLLIAKEKAGIISTMNQQHIIKLAAVKAHGNIVNIAGDLLTSKGMATHYGDYGNLCATALGIQSAGQLERILEEEVEKERMQVEAAKATVRSATIMEDQLEQAKVDAQRAHVAMVWSIIAAGASALIAVLTWIFPRH